MEAPPKFEPVTVENIPNQIGLVQEWFLKKLHENGEAPLVEDDDLPAKQRFPKPRLPPTGKISSPRKRPLKEQQQMARKKRKLDEEKENNPGNDSSFGPNGTSSKGHGKLDFKPKLPMPQQKENVEEPEKENGSALGMISPESQTAA
jgi:transcriptional activator SPT7